MITQGLDSELAEHNQRAYCIPPTGAHHVIVLPDDPSEHLTRLQGAVGGWVEVHPLPDALLLWLNEEGRITNLARNHTAEHVVTQLGAELIAELHGTAVITGRGSNEGEPQGLTRGEIDRLHQLTESVIGA